MDPFGDYTLLEKIASGGMADIFRAAKVGARGFRKYFAIKRILSHISEDKDIQDMFVKEAHILSTANHSNVVQIYELGEVQGQYFIAMNYIEGKNLRSFLDSAYQNGYVIPLEIILYIFSCIIDGLDYVHQLTDNDGQCINIVHRDINPNNILLSYNGEVKIIDFGIVKSDIDTEKTKHGVIKGKLSYLSPEQLEGKEINQQTDVFAVGTVLYEMLARKRLFNGKTESEIFTSLINLDLPKEISLLSLPPAITEILNRLLARDLTSRFSSMSEVKEALLGYIKSENLQLSRLQLCDSLQGLFIEDIADEARKKTYYDQFLTEGGAGSPEEIEKTQVFEKDSTAVLQRGADPFFEDKAKVSASSQVAEDQTRVFTPDMLSSEEERGFDDATNVMIRSQNQEEQQTKVPQSTELSTTEKTPPKRGRASRIIRLSSIILFLVCLVAILAKFFLPEQKENINIPLNQKNLSQNDTGPVQVSKTAASGVLHITGTPAGQTVYINGAVRGQLPQTITLEPGFYEVQCQRENWRPYQVGVKLREGKTLDITCNLEATR